MKKFFLYAVVSLAALLLAACSQSGGDNSSLVNSGATDITISSQDLQLSQAAVSASEFSMLHFSAQVTGDAAAEVEWSVSPTSAQLVHDDSSTHNITLLTPAASEGTVTLTARSGNAEASVSFGINQKQATRRLVFISEPSIMLFGDNTSRKLEARLLDENNQPVDAAITFTSSNPAAISVAATTGQDALVRSDGTVASAVVTARYGDLEASTVVLYAQLGDDSRFVEGDDIISAEGNTVILKRTAATQALTSGDVVVSDSAYGLADKIVSVDASGEHLVLTVKHVQPYEAFKEINTDIELPVADITAQLVGNGQGVLSTYSPSGELMNQTMIESTSCKDANGNTSELSLEGSDITLKTRVTSDFQYRAGHYTTYLFRLALHTESDLSITAGKLTFSNANGDKINCSIDLGSENVAVTQICPWGLGIKYNSAINLAAEGTQEGGNLVVDNALTATFNQTSNVGVQYTQQNGWQRIAEAEVTKATAEPVQASQFDITKEFKTTIAGSASHTFFVNVCKGQIVCCYYYYRGCYYRYCRRVYRHVANFTFINLNSSVTLNAQNTLNDNCSTLNWKIDFDAQGALDATMTSRASNDKKSFNYFTYWVLCIDDMLELPANSGFSKQQSSQGEIQQQDCNDDGNDDPEPY